MLNFKWTGFLLSFPSVCYAAEPLWFIANAHGSSAYTQTSVWDGVVTGLNGRQYDFSRFYKSKSITFNLAADVYFPISESSYFVLPVKIDSGYKSDLYMASPQFTMGLGLAYATPHFSVRLIARGLNALGGSVKERPCRDSFDRAFHCGTALPWSDVKPYLLTDSNTAGSVSLRAVWKF